MKKFSIKNFKGNLPLLCSACAGLLLFCTSLPAVMPAFCIGCILFLSSFFIKFEVKHLFCKKSAVIFCALALFIALAQGYIFAVNVFPSSKIGSLAQMLGCSKKTLLGSFTAVCSIASVFSITVFLCFLRDSTSLDKPVNERLSQIITGILGLCVIIMLSAVLLLCFNGSVWYDEAYSLINIPLSFREIIYMQVHDVHPPLYYFLLKCFTYPATVFFPGSVYATIAASKICSVIPMVILGMICFFSLKKDYWLRWLILLSLFIPCFCNYATEVRMYSWAVLFVTAAYLCVQKIMQDPSDRKSWLLFAAMSLCSAYTHNFALIAIAFLWGILFLWIFICARDRIITFFVMASIVAVLYFPWFIVLLQQAGRVKANYWISPITAKSLGGYFCSMFPALLGIVPAITVFREKRTDIKTLFNDYFGVLIPLSVLLFGVIVSWVTRPIFIFRYLVPCLPCLWIPLLAISCAQKNLKRLIITCLMLLVTITNLLAFTSQENRRGRNAEQNIALLTSTEEKSCIIVDSTSLHMPGEVAGYIHRDIYATVNPAIFPDVQEITEKTAVSNLLKKYESVYVLRRIEDDKENTRIAVSGAEWNTEFLGNYFFSAGQVEAFKITAK